MLATDTTTNSQDPTQALFGQMLRNRLTTLRERFDPVHGFKEEASLHKAIQLSLRIDSLHQLAIEVYLQTFAVIIQRRPLPAWRSLLDEALSVAEKRNHDLYTAKLLAFKCQYLREIEDLEGLLHEGKQALQSQPVKKSPTAQAAILIYLAIRHFIRREFDQALDLVNLAKNTIPEPKTIEEYSLCGKILNVQGIIKGEQHKIFEATQAYDQALKYLEQSRDLFTLNLTRANFAYYIATEEDGLDKVETMKDVREFFRQQNYLFAENVVLVNIAVVYDRHQQFDQSETYLKAMDVEYLYKIPATTTLALHHNNIGNLYFNQGLFKLAEIELTSAINVYNELGNQHFFSLANAKALLGTLYSKTNNIEKSDNVLLESLSILHPLVENGDTKAANLYEEISEEFPHLEAFPLH